jgi:alanine racemase
VLGGSRLCAVVKANGYGHGAVECARAALAGGATWLAVAAAVEAAELRSQLPDARLLTMGALTEAELDLALGADSDVAAWRRGFAHLVGERGAELGVRPRVHVKYDTGMGRLGERDPDAVLALVDAVAADDRLDLAGLWTHFATADEPDSDFFGEQLGRFARLAERVRAEHPDLLVHAANSAATLRDPASHFDMARCGIAIYGLDPFHSDPFARGLEPALELRSYVADTKRFPAGASAGYGQRWRAPADTWVGVLPIGYGDGVRRGLTNNGEALVGGKRYPFVGTVSMDNVTVDLGPASSVEPGSAAVLIGAQGDDRILCEEVARRLETINYEITCGIAPRVLRVHVRSAGP